MMRNGTRAIGRRLVLAATMAMSAALAWPSTGNGQGQPPDQAKQAHQPQPASPADDSLAAQLQQLREKVAKLEAALSHVQGAGQPSPMGRGQGMGMGARAAGKGADQVVRVSARYQDCLRCHQTRPGGPLPPSHVEQAGAMDMSVVGGGGPGGRGKPDAMPMSSNDSPIDQIQQLRAKVAALEAGLAQDTAVQGAPDMAMGMPGQGGQGMSGRQGMGGGMGMGMMSGGGGGMGMMGGGSGGMGMMGDDGMMGMGSMGKAKRMGMGDMNMATHLPGFPGISHLYHIGAEGFFLNHDEHISLSANQRKKLNQIKQKAVLGGSSCQRKVEEAEQELWELTASDTPDAAAIEAKVREIEKLRADQRLAYIRAVGEAAKVLTDDQRLTLAGTATDTSPKPATPNP